MRLIWKIYISVGIFIIFLLISLGILIAVLKWTWWIFGLLTPFLIIAYLIAGGWILWKIKKSLEPQIQQISLKNATDKVLHYMKYESENPDNFVIEGAVHGNVGQGTPTPMIMFHGYGYELNQSRVILFHGVTGKISDLKPNPTEEDIKKAIEMFPDFPKEYEETENIEQSPFGIITKRSRKPKTYEKKIEEEAKKEADELNT